MACHIAPVPKSECGLAEAARLCGKADVGLLLGLWSYPSFPPSLSLRSRCGRSSGQHSLRFASCAQDSLLRLKDHRQCFECSDVALNEAVQQMLNSNESAAKEEWVATVTQLLLGIEQALSSDSSGSILKESSSTTGLVRLTNNLIQVTPGFSLSYAVSAGGL